MALSFPRRGAVAAGALAVLVSIICVRLGMWQLDRLEQRRALNEVIRNGSALPEVDLHAGLLDSIAADPSLFSYRAVRVVGTFDPPPFLLRSRAHQGRPGVYLFTPLRLQSGELLVVNQGWLPSPDASTADPRPYELRGVHALHGRIQPLRTGNGEVVRSEVPLPGYPITSYLRLDQNALARDLGEAPLPIVLQLTDRPTDAAELPIPIPPPDLDEGSHFGYAIQWFSFAAISLGGFLIMALRSRRQS